MRTSDWQERGLTAAERSTRARIAAHTLHSRRDSKELTARARDAFLARFLMEADPEGLLPLEERQRRAEHGLRAHMARLALRSAQARRKGKTHGSRKA